MAFARSEARDLSFSALPASFLWGRAAHHGDHFIHKGFHLFRLGIHLFRGGSRFLGTGGILLNHLVHLGNRRIDLVDALGLFVGSGCDISPTSSPTFSALSDLS